MTENSTGNGLPRSAALGIVVLTGLVALCGISMTVGSVFLAVLFHPAFWALFGIGIAVLGLSYKLLSTYLPPPSKPSSSRRDSDFDSIAQFTGNLSRGARATLALMLMLVPMAAIGLVIGSVFLAITVNPAFWGLFGLSIGLAAATIPLALGMGAGMLGSADRRERKTEQ